MAKSNKPSKRKFLWGVLSSGKRNLRKFVKILNEMHENNSQSKAMIESRPFSVHPRTAVKGLSKIFVQN